MSISQRAAGISPAGATVTEYTLKNRGGASVSILDFGGVVTKICVPDQSGKLGDVNLGFDDVGVYAGDSGSMGALIGRFGNRIGGAGFELDGQTYVLGKNNGENNLHGGPEGFNVRMWRVEASEQGTEDALSMQLVSGDGDQGFPGQLTVTVVYSWNDACELKIHYHATTDKPTILNLTNHCYFNLDGHDAGTVENLVLQINADCVTEVKPDLIPTGKLLPTKGLCYNFTEPTLVGEVLAKTDSCPIMKAAGGVDFNYCAGRDLEVKTIATLYSPKTGRVMDVITDLPGVQCYTGQGLHHTGKEGVRYGRFAGICLETQRYPDAIHHPHFPSVVLRPQDVYDTVTTYRFSIR
ncbi:MAG: aldose epimerase family protein [Clostridia bacterium]